MKQILVTNDDGIHSCGFYPLLRELSKKFSIVPVVPASEQSWIGKKITRNKRITVKKVRLNEFEVYTMSGTPADCAQIGIYDYCSQKPAFVVSGINIGENTGHGKILSSGTVGAAMEASIDGVKSIASSMHIPKEKWGTVDYFSKKNLIAFENAAKITAKVVSSLCGFEFGEDIDLISINIPFEASLHSAFEITTPHRNPYGRLFHKVKGRYQYFHVDPPITLKSIQKGTDMSALSQGKVSITPITLDLSSKNSIRRLRMFMENKSCRGIK